MSEQVTYHPLEALHALSDAELRALWELVPTERQRAYRAAYEREVRTAGAAGSDALERRVNAELLKRYAETALVPVGLRWARTPTRVQETARLNTSPVTEEADQPAARPSRRVVIVFGLAICLLVGVLFMRMTNRSAENAVTPTSALRATSTALALAGQDDVIQGGDGGREAAYPVSLQVMTNRDDAPRVWVVQRRRVSTSDWNYDPNPDTASFLSGMAVRPVIGIPWSEDNRDLFDMVSEGTTFTLTMNTGAVLTFAYASRAEVRRSDTAIFRQIAPGLVLLLIGEVDDNGLPTAARTIITASYAADQELSRTGELIGLVLPTPLPALVLPSPTPIPFAGLNVELVSVTHITGQVTTQLRLYNGGTEAIRLTQDDIWIAFGYAPTPLGPRVPAEGLQPFDLLPGQAVDLTLVWLWSGESYGGLSVGLWTFDITLLSTPH